jgi:hypothetical protein
MSIFRLCSFSVPFSYCLHHLPPFFIFFVCNISPSVCRLYFPFLSNFPLSAPFFFPKFRSPLLIFSFLSSLFWVIT